MGVDVAKEPTVGDSTAQPLRLTQVQLPKGATGDSAHDDAGQLTSALGKATGGDVSRQHEQFG
jgi:hypothetical protein